MNGIVVSENYYLDDIIDSFVINNDKKSSCMMNRGYIKVIVNYTERSYKINMCPIFRSLT